MKKLKAHLHTCTPAHLPKPLFYGVPNLRSLIMSMLFVFFLGSCQKNETIPLPRHEKGMTENRESNPCFPADQETCNDTYVYNTPISYKGCIVYASYRVTTCTLTNNCIRVNISDFSWTYGTSTACKKLKADFGAFVLVGDWASYYAAFNVFYKSMTQQIELIVMQDFITNGGNPEGCLFTLDWIESGCITFCQDGVDEDGTPILIQELCGAGCCFRRTTYTVGTGNEPIPGTPTITPGGVCDPIANECVTGTNPCNAVCDRL